MRVIPAVDVLDGEAVRLTRGAFDDVVARGGDPAALAASFAAAGASLIHVVDLEGSRSGRIRPDLVARLAEAARPASIQASGGIRSLDDAERLLAAGAVRVVVGTAAFADAAALGRYVDGLGDRLVVALDVRDGQVAVAGWTRRTKLTIADAAHGCAAAGVPRVLCTAVERDGTLAGPDLALLALVVAAGIPVLAAGGISSPADLEAVAAAGCEGAIVGRALLDGTLPLAALGPAG